MSTKKSAPRPQKHVPQRTCLVCRQKTDKRQLTRIVRTPEGHVVIDTTGKQNGRGAYICQQPACWHRLVSTKQIVNQALKTMVTDADMAQLASHIPTIASE